MITDIEIPAEGSEVKIVYQQDDIIDGDVHTIREIIGELYSTDISYSPTTTWVWIKTHKRRWFVTGIVWADVISCEVLTKPRSKLGKRRYLGLGD